LGGGWLWDAREKMKDENGKMKKCAARVVLLHLSSFMLLLLSLGWSQTKIGLCLCAESDFWVKEVALLRECFLSLFLHGLNGFDGQTRIIQNFFRENP
jgi:hypothetical protein